MTSRIAVVLLALLAPFALAACGKSADTQFLTLDAAPGATAVSYRGPPIRIPSVDIPPALDRVEFARQAGPGEIKVEDLVHWSAPLGLLARNTLILDLAQRLPSGAVLPPDGGPQSGSIRASVSILSFGVANGEASMFVTYAFIRDDLPGVVGNSQWAQLRTPAGGTTPVETARAFSALLGGLADRMAADITLGSGTRKTP
jgi:uncharacterized lipoprotein YmbA